MKELYNFEIFFFLIRPTDPTSQGGGRWEMKHFIGMALYIFDGKQEVNNWSVPQKHIRAFGMKGY